MDISRVSGNSPGKKERKRERKTERKKGVKWHMWNMMKWYIYAFVYTVLAVVQQNWSKIWDGVEFVGGIAIECKMK